MLQSGSQKLPLHQYGRVMNKKTIGIALIIIGVVLAAWGYNVFDSPGSHISRALQGSAPIQAWAGMLGGALCVLLGIWKVK